MAGAVVSAALEKLADIAAALAWNKVEEEIGLVTGVEEELLSLSNELTVIRDVLEDAEKREYKEKSLQNWLKRVEKISYDVEDVLDEWDYAILKLRNEGSENVENFVTWMSCWICSFIPWSCLCIKKVVTRHDIAVKIKELKERLDGIVKEKDRYGLVVGQVVDPRESDRVRSTSLLDVKEIQGRKDDTDVLVNKLILEGAGQESCPNVISIVGTGGIGKTTIAQLVYNDERVKKIFTERIWICVSDVFDEVRIAKGIVEIVTTSSPNVHELEAVLKRVTDNISGKKFLLVLDDVWTEDYNKWEPLKNSLKCGGLGSKILVTTRNERVARMMGTIEIYPLGQLSDEECWSLMKMIAFSGRREEEHEQLYDIGKNIAKKCKGLPLAAKVLGSLLCLKDTMEDWENILNSEIWQMENAEVNLFPHLLLSYNELSSAMKRCFSYCAIFPKDYDINVEELIRMWMALGYLGSDRSPGDLELRGKEYFDNLRMRSFFQDLEGRHDTMFCKMHDIVHDFAQFLTKRRSHDSEDHDGKVEESEKMSCQALDSSLLSQINVNRSLFHPKEIPLDLLGSVTCLKMLSLPLCGMEKIPGNIANLIHLRYLDLSNNHFIQLRDLQAICKLYNLQTLNLRNCKVEEIPTEIRNLIELRHLDLSWNSLDKIPREIGNLIQLRHLNLMGNEYLEELPETIYSLHNLRYLNLQDCSLYILPEGIHRLRNLRHLLTDYGFLFPQGLESLTGLQTLTKFTAGRDGGKLRYLKEMDQLSGSLNLQIYLDDQEDVEEAKKAALRNKKHIESLEIKFLTFDLFNDMSDGDKLFTNEVMEVLLPPPNLQCLTISSCPCTKFPSWMTSFLNHLKVLDINMCNYCEILPPLGKLPCLEKLWVGLIREFKFLDREFLGISGDIDGSTPSSAVVIAFPKLKVLDFNNCLKWKEWEDITAEEEINSALLIMPCLTELAILGCELTALPHRLLRKASALEHLIVESSSHTWKLSEDKNGPEGRSLYQIPRI